MSMSIIGLLLILLGVLGVGGLMAAVVGGVLARKKKSVIPEVLSEDDRRSFLRRCDAVLNTFKGVGNQRADDPLDRAVEGLFPLLLKWREHLAEIPEIPLAAKDLPDQWEDWQRLLIRTLEAEEKGAVGAADGVAEVARSFAALQDDYGQLLGEVERGQTNDLVVEARVLQRLADMDDRMHPFREPDRIRS